MIMMDFSGVDCGGTGICGTSAGRKQPRNERIDAEMG